MISNIIQLGKNVDTVPFSELVDPNQKIIEMKLGIGDSTTLILESADVKDAGDKKLYHISPTKAINRGKSQHFYPHDFTLSSKFILDDGSERKIPGIDQTKVRRNYENTRNCYEGLNLEQNFKRFLKAFYRFVLKDDSRFIKDAFHQTESFFEDLTKTEFGNIIFAFSLSKQVVDYFNLNTNFHKDYYNLGEIEDFKDFFNILIISETLEIAHEDTNCSFCGASEQVLVPNSATIYFSFAKNPENVFYQLDNQNANKHLLICKDCYKNYNVGKKFMEEHLRSNLLGSKYFSIFEIGEEAEKIRESLEFLVEQKVETIYTNESLKKLHEVLEDNQQILMDLGVIGEREGLGISMFFYEYDNGYRVLKTIHDIYPTRILDLLKENSRFSNFSFNAFLNSFFRDQGNNAYDLLVKWKLDLLEKILLDIPVNYDSLLERFINKATYKLRNGQNTETFTQRFLKFLELLNRLNIEIYSSSVTTSIFNEGGSVLGMNSTEKLEGKTGLEKMRNFIRENEFLASMPEIRAAIPLGVIIARLSQHEIANYDKRMLGFAQRRITDKESLKKYFNEIEEKVVMHEMQNQKIVSDFSEQMPKVFSKDEFSSDDFILGLFVGYSLAPKFTNE